MFKSVAGLVLLTVLSAQAQPPAQKKTARGLSVDSILSMVQAGISESVIVARIRRESQGLDVEPGGSGTPEACRRHRRDPACAPRSQG